MTDDQWSRIKHFKPEEFDSPGAPGSGAGMEFAFVQKLDDLREMLGIPLKINSGIRTAEHNSEVGGVDGSAHTEGWASDLYCRTSRDRLRMLRAAMVLGFNRIGIGTTFIHLDTDPTKPRDVAWLY